MKLLLTSAGVSNPSIRNALVDLLGKQVSQASALFIPTAIYAIPLAIDLKTYTPCWGKSWTPKITEGRCLKVYSFLAKFTF